MKSSTMQNPSDPKSASRSKAGKEHQRYVASLEESAGEHDSIVTEYQYEQNTHSDNQFIQEHLKQVEQQDEQTVIVTDRAYSGTENTQLAAIKKVELITTGLTGKATPDVPADFEFNKTGTKALRCPTGHAPKSYSCMQQSNQCAVSCMNSKEFKNYAKFRNRVEAIPSNIRKNSHLEKMPHEKQHDKFFSGSKAAALNFRKLFNYVKVLRNYAPNLKPAQNKAGKIQHVSPKVR